MIINILNGSLNSHVFLLAIRQVEETPTTCVVSPVLVIRHNLNYADFPYLPSVCYRS